MAKLSQAQIAMYAQSAGMSDPITMSAIAMAESGGNPRAHNAIPPDNSYGLWQINMLGAMGPSRRAQYGISSNEQLYDPATNARAAAKILAGQGPSAWSTYSSGAYKRYLPKTSGTGKAVQAGWWDDFWDGFGKGFDTGPGPEDLWDGGTSNDPSLDGLGDVATGVGAIAEAVQKTAVWMANPKNWVRIGYVVGGGLLVGMGLFIVAKPIIQQATPVGQLAKKASGAVKSRKASKAPAKSKETSE